LPDARLRTPKPVAEKRPSREAQLSPAEGIVLARIDGSLTERDLAGATGLSEEQVQASLRTLEAQGLIRFGESDADAGGAGAVGPFMASPLNPPLTPEEERELKEDVDLDEAMRRKILVLHRSLERLDHYSVLGLERSADRKALKRAYYELAAAYHPDRYFRKKLGTFKVRMESIFGRITLAHDTLTDKVRRAEYDAYLDEQRRSRGIEELLAAALAEAKRAEDRIEREARQELGPSPGSSSQAPPPPAQAAPARPPGPTIEAGARRDALARRLLGGRVPAMSSAPPPARSGASVSSAEAMEALRRRYEERLAQAKAAQTRKYVANAQTALAAGDPVAAANAFRVALTLSPADTELQKSARETQLRADAILSETYTRQAAYEEKNGQWAEAARSWVRVVKARPNDAPAHERAAAAIVKASGDLHEASRLAQQACALEPTAPSFRITLANVYLAAGLTLNARRELETAAQLAPHDGTIQAMLRRVGKA
jgi:curved DNA-binding protein CbpA